MSTPWPVVHTKVKTILREEDGMALWLPSVKLLTILIHKAACNCDFLLQIFVEQDQLSFWREAQARWLLPGLVSCVCLGALIFSYHVKYILRICIFQHFLASG